MLNFLAGFSDYLMVGLATLTILPLVLMLLPVLLPIALIGWAVTLLIE